MNSDGKWTKPNGGCFISFDALDGCAKRIAGLFGDAMGKVIDIYKKELGVS